MLVVCQANTVHHCMFRDEWNANPVGILPVTVRTKRVRCVAPWEQKHALRARRWQLFREVRDYLRGGPRRRRARGIGSSASSRRCGRRRTLARCSWLFSPTYQRTPATTNGRCIARSANQPSPRLLRITRKPKSVSDLTSRREIFTTSRHASAWGLTVRSRSVA